MFSIIEKMEFERVLSRLGSVEEYLAAADLKHTREWVIRFPPYFRKSQKYKSYLLEMKFHKYSSAFFFGSPESYALTTGFLRGDFLFPARLHMGARRSLDARLAAYQALQLKALKKMYDEVEKNELLIVDFLREGPQTCLQENLFLHKRLDFVNVVLSVSHNKDNRNILGRGARIAEVNFEGVDFDKVKVLFLSDSIAGGITMFYSLEYLLERFPNLEQVVIFSIHLARVGLCVLSEYFRLRKIKGIFVGFGALLESNPPQMYYSPLPVYEPEFFADARHKALSEFLYQDLAGRICVAGNWTAMFLSPPAALQELESELSEHGKDSYAICSREIDNKILSRFGFEREDLMPASEIFLSTEGFNKLL